MRRIPDWLVLVAVDPDDGFYDDLTWVKLDSDSSHEFRLLAYEGSYVSQPGEDDARVILNPPSPSPSQPTGIIVQSRIKAILAMALIGK